MNTIEQFNEHVMQTYGRIGLVMESGHGQTAVGEDGKEYIDFGSGIGTNSLGYCDEDWVNAICEQAHKIQHTSNYYYTKVQADFAKRLCEATGYEKMFFGNSGAEANECAIKLARKYSFDKYGKDAERNIIITLVERFALFLQQVRRFSTTTSSRSLVDLRMLSLMISTILWTSSTNLTTRFAL